MLNEADLDRLLASVPSIPPAAAGLADRIVQRALATPQPPIGRLAIAPRRPTARRRLVWSVAVVANGVALAAAAASWDGRHFDLRHLAELPRRVAAAIHLPLRHPATRPDVVRHRVIVPAVDHQVNPALPTIHPLQRGSERRMLSSPAPVALRAIHLPTSLRLNREAILHPLAVRRHHVVAGYIVRQQHVHFGSGAQHRGSLELPKLHRSSLPRSLPTQRDPAAMRDVGDHPERWGGLPPAAGVGMATDGDRPGIGDGTDDRATRRAARAQRQLQARLARGVAADRAVPAGAGGAAVRWPDQPEGGPAGEHRRSAIEDGAAPRGGRLGWHHADRRPRRGVQSGR